MTKRLSKEEKERNRNIFAKERSMQYTGSGNPFFNKHHTEETKKKISEKKEGTPSPRKGAVLTKETKNKMRLAAIGRPSPRRGITLSEETKRKISESKKKLAIPENTKEDRKE